MRDWYARAQLTEPRPSGDPVRSLTFSSKRRRSLAVASALAAGASTGLSGAAVAAPERRRFGIDGHAAPEIKLDYWIDRSGEPGQFSVVQNRGKWVFLKCFQDWCPGCHSSGFPTLQQFSAAFADHPKVAIAAIQTVFEGFSSNTQEDVRKLQLRYELPITMGHDPGDANTHGMPRTMKAYRTGGTPWLILIAPDGRVIFNDYHVNTDKLIDYVRKQIA